MTETKEKEGTRYLTVKQAASYMNMAVWAVRQLIWGREIPVVKQGKGYIIDQRDLDHWFQSKKTTL
jgi:excisionase family DNA binding protein